MAVSNLSLRLAKLVQVSRSRRSMRGLVNHGVLAGAEHRWILSPDLSLVVDIGANRGQFALAVRQWAPKARVISFEPLPVPASTFRKLFSGDDQVVLHQAAIGYRSEQRLMHVSKRDDSSSLLPIAGQSTMFPGTEELTTAEVHVAPLDEFVDVSEIRDEAIIKLDVQGYEYEALLGCLSMLDRFRQVYCECSFVELYAGQRLACDIIALLADHGFSLAGVHNPFYDDSGRCIQADLLFSRRAA